MKRIKFVRGSDRFNIEDKVFERGGHSIEVSNELGEHLLKDFPEYDFEEISTEDRAAEDKTDKASAAQATRDAEGAAKMAAIEEEAAARRGAFYEGKSVEVAIEAGVPVTEEPAESEQEVAEEQAEETAADSTVTSATDKGSQDARQL